MATKLMYHVKSLVDGEDRTVTMPWASADDQLGRDIIEVLQRDDVDQVWVVAHTYPYNWTEGSGSWSEPVVLKDTRERKVVSE